MASFHYSIRTTQKKSTADVMVRICFSAYIDGRRVMSYGQSGVKVPKKAWDSNKGCIKEGMTALGGSGNEGGSLDESQNDLNEIKKLVNDRFNMLGEKEKLSSEWLQGVVNEYWGIRSQMVEEESQAKAELATRETLNKYIDRYISEIESGTRLTNKGTKFAKSTIKSTKGAFTQFKEFQKATKCEVDFDDVDLQFYNRFVGWLQSKNYATNTIGKCIKEIKNLMELARDEHLHTNEEYKSRRFRATSEEADNIYLTWDELEAIMSVDLSKMAKGYSDARDVFLAGCWLAQRVSDYNHLTPENIVVENFKSITDEDKVEVIERTYIVITQQKTKERVKIPANSYMMELLRKHDNKLPYIWEQKLNSYIKRIARMAGITQREQITSTKGGETKTEMIERCELIVSHTARRTGATLMYLGGMDIYDICKITGHTSVKTLRKYIKASNLDVAEKITKYDFFK